ncbi:34156_t:CDS:2, partial [Racocetra persica]
FFFVQVDAGSLLSWVGAAFSWVGEWALLFFGWILTSFSYHSCKSSGNLGASLDLQQL